MGEVISRFGFSCPESVALATTGFTLLLIRGFTFCSHHSPHHIVTRTVEKRITKPQETMVWLENASQQNCGLIKTLARNVCKGGACYAIVPADQGHQYHW